jgi:hypothetical protein
MKPPSIKATVAALQAGYLAQIIGDKPESDVVVKHSAGNYTFYMYARPVKSNGAERMTYRVVAVRGDPSALNSIRRDGYPVENELTKAALRPVVKRLLEECEAAAVPSGKSLANERRRARRAEKRGARTITCVICGQPYAPKSTEHNVFTHPGECRQALIHERWRRSDQRKRRYSPSNTTL